MNENQLREVYPDLQNTLIKIEQELDNFAYYVRGHDPDDTRLDVIELVLLAAARSGLVLRPMLEVLPALSINSPGQEVTNKLERVAAALENISELMLRNQR